MGYFKYEHDNYDYDLGSYGTVLKDIQYNNLSDKNRIDLYIPKIEKESYPLIIYIHGGGFAQGDKTHHLGGILQGLQRGYAVAGINYRLGSEAPYPAFLADVCEGIRYLKEHATMLQLDKEKFALWGDTHGGYIASKIAIEGDKGLLDNLETNYPQQDLKVCGVVSFYGPMDLADFYKNQVATGNYLIDIDGSISDERTFQKKGQELIGFLKGLGPLPNVDGSEPPFYLLHGRLDFNIDQKYTRIFADTLEKYNVKHTLNFVEEGIHAIDFYEVEKYNEPIMKFFDEIFV